jgi:predicted metal-dependent enzyme (double-stranded beta helix superfamily)
MPHDQIELTDFVADVEVLVAAETDPHAISAAVQARLLALLGGKRFLTREQQEPDPAHYRSHILAVAPSRKFSVVGLVWLPGQVTPIHDHICWCVVGVVQGVEREERFGLRCDETDTRWLTPMGRETLTAGHTCALVPPEENIHRVCNAGDDLAISIHVYGEDIERYKSSINQCFDGVPIRKAEDGATAGAEVAWRRIRWE